MTSPRPDPSHHEVPRTYPAGPNDPGEDPMVPTRHAVEEPPGIITQPPTPEVPEAPSPPSPSP